MPEDETVSGFPAMIGQAKPDSVRARMFNGWGSRQPGLTISSALGSNGASNIVSTTIQPEEISSPSFYFQNRSATAPTVTGGLVAAPDWTFEIVAGAAQCPEDLCVRAIGPLSTFTNPFAGGPVAIVWAESDNTAELAASGTQVATDNLTLQWRVATIAEPNFNDPQPTRDSGENRLYEWSFSLEGANPGFTNLENLVIAAIGIRPSGDALRTAPFRVGEPPVQEFNVVFNPTSATVDVGGTQGYNVELAPSSLTDGFTVNSCAITETSNLTAGATATVAENSCLFDAGTADPGDTFTIRAIVESDGGTTRTIFATATVRAPFAIQLGEGANVEINAPDFTATVDFPVSVITGGPIGTLTCTVQKDGTTTIAGVTATSAEGNTVCRVTVNAATFADGGAGTFEVTANAGESGSTRSASDAEDFVITEVASVFAFERTGTAAAPLIISEGAGETFDLLFVTVSGARLPGAISDADCRVDDFTGTGTVPTASFATDLGPDENLPGCRVQIAVDVAAGDEFTVDAVDIDSDGPAGGRTLDGPINEAFFEVAEPFSVAFEEVTSAGSRFEIERNRTHNFLVDADASEFVGGIDLDSPQTTASVSPSDGGVTAVVNRAPGVDGPFRVQVTVPADADTGNYDVSVTFAEEGTGRVATATIFITVTPTGQIVIDG